MAHSRHIVPGNKMVDPKERMFCRVDGLEVEGLIYKHGHVCLVSMHI